MGIRSSSQALVAVAKKSFSFDVKVFLNFRKETSERLEAEVSVVQLLTKIQN
jgi:hypothetical protein